MWKLLPKTHTRLLRALIIFYILIIVGLFYYKECGIKLTRKHLVPGELLLPTLLYPPQIPYGI